MPTVMRTLVFEIHNPSRRTASVLYRALAAYTRAAGVVTDAARRDWDRVRSEALMGTRPPSAPASDQGRTRSTPASDLAAVLSRRYKRLTEPYPLHSSLRDALFADLAGALASYDALVTRWLAERERVRQRLVDAGMSTDTLALDPRAVALLDGLGDPPSWPSVPRPRPDDARAEQAHDDLLLVPDLAPPGDEQDAGQQTTATRTHQTATDGDASPAARLQARLLRRLDGPVTPRTAHVPRGPASFLRTGTRPLWFGRPDGVDKRRNMALVHTEADGRYYILLYLLPQGDPHARPLRTNPRRGTYRAVHPSGATLATGERAVGALLLPLACGDWHVQTALAPALADPQSVRTARLVHRGARRTPGGVVRPASFRVAITFEQQVPDPCLVTTWMGVSLAEDGTVAWTVRARPAGTGGAPVVATGEDTTLVGLQERWRQDRRLQMRAGRLPPRAHHLQAEQVSHAVHLIANRLVAVAAEHGAQIGLEDVTYLRHRRPLIPRSAEGTAAARTESYHQALADQQYRRAMLVGGTLKDILGYKAPRAGLPRPLSVSGISPRDCDACGGRGTERQTCGLCGAPLGPRTTARVVSARIGPILERISAARTRRDASLSKRGTRVRDASDQAGPTAAQPDDASDPDVVD